MRPWRRCGCGAYTMQTIPRCSAPTCCHGYVLYLARFFAARRPGRASVAAVPSFHQFTEKCGARSVFARVFRNSIPGHRRQSRDNGFEIIDRVSEKWPERSYTHFARTGSSLIMIARDRHAGIGDKGNCPPNSMEGLCLSYFQKHVLEM